MIESIFRQFDKYGHHEVEYFPHPKDSSILIDSSPAKRQLNTLETQLKNIISSPSTPNSDPRPKPSTYAQISKSKPKVIVGTATISGKCQPVLEPVKTIAVKLTVNASTTKENIETQLFTESNVFSKLKTTTKVEELYSDKKTANFRVSCTTWPVYKSFLEPEIWPTGAEIRPWYGPIQDLSKRLVQRILIRNLASTSTVDGVKKTVTKLFEDKQTDVNIQVLKRKHNGTQLNGPTSQFIIEIKSSIHFDDYVSPYFENLHESITVRKWRGRLPQENNIKPNYISLA